MRRLISSAAPAALAAVVVVALLAPGAAAQHGNGLYEPFPQAAVKKRAKRFVSRLAIPLRLDDKDLARGVFVTRRALPREGGAPAAARAGVDRRGGRLPGSVLQLALVALALTGGWVLARRRSGHLGSA